MNMSCKKKIMKKCKLKKTTNPKWRMLRETHESSGNEILSRKNSQERNEWVTAEILGVMKKRQ